MNKQDKEMIDKAIASLEAIKEGKAMVDSQGTTYNDDTYMGWKDWEVLDLIDLKPKPETREWWIRKGFSESLDRIADYHGGELFEPDWIHVREVLPK